MKIIVADDDKLIRYYTQSLIAEVMNEPYEMLEAANGQALIDLCLLHSPDIAFVDIKMPYVDGISAIEQAKMSCPNTNFVVLTAYADFSYAKRCISLGVTDYLLKPIERETLENVLNHLKIKINKETSFDNFKFQHKVISLFNNPNIKNVGKDVDKNVEHGDFLYFEFFILCNNYDEIYHSIYSKLSNELGDLADNLLKYGNKSALFHSKRGNLALVIQSVKDNQDYIIHSINLILKEYNKSCNISCLSTNSSTLTLLPEHAANINQKYYCIFANKTGIVHDIQAAASGLSPDDFAFLELFFKVISAYIDGNEPEYTIHIKNILSHTKMNLLKINFEELQSYTNKITGQNLKEQQSPKQFFKELLALGEGLKINISQSSLNKMDLIKEYVDKNYMKDISITSISEIYKLSPNYVSKLFHEKFGTKFTDYLTQVRIYNAKLLLASNNDISIKSVASMVGYNSPRHFTNIFYKLTNIYPSDYRKSLKL
ncbi:response regulator transcription factor [Paenibacillus marinisediminis]